MMSEDTYEDKLSAVDAAESREASEEKEMFPGFQGFLFTPQELERNASRGLMKCQCIQCGRIFFIPKNQIQARIKARRTICCCSAACTAQYKKERKKSSKKEYCCATCGKHVSSNEYYGSGRFCCQKCSNAYSSKFGNTTEKRKQKSNKLLEHGKKKVVKPCHKCGKPIECSEYANNALCAECRKKKYKSQVNRNENVKQQTKLQKLNEESILYQQVLKLYHLYNFKEMNEVLKIDTRLLRSVIRKYNVQQNPALLPVQQFGRIKYTKLILDIQDRSVTYHDFIRAKLILEHHYHVEMMSPEEIKKMYNIEYSCFDMCLKGVFGITLRNLSESSRNYHQKIGTYDNKTEKELYYMQCAFRFPRSEYSRIPGFELVNQYGWYKPAKNRWFGATRDHMISRNYGWTHKIDPEIIRHPANCQIMLSTDNSSKGEKCTITVEELMERIKHWED